MKKIISVALIGMLSLALAGPADAARGFAGGFHGGFHHHGFHHRAFHHGRCCFGPAFVGGLFVGAALAFPYYPYPYYAYGYPYPVYAGAVYQAPVTVAAAIQREVCYPGGCYRLQGDGVTVAYQWAWVPAAPAPPWAPPSQY